MDILPNHSMIVELQPHLRRWSRTWNRGFAERLLSAQSQAQHHGFTSLAQPSTAGSWLSYPRCTQLPLTPTMTSGWQWEIWWTFTWDIWDTHWDTTMSITAMIRSFFRMWWMTLYHLRRTVQKGGVLLKTISYAWSPWGLPSIVTRRKPEVTATKQWSTLGQISTKPSSTRLIFLREYWLA